MTSAIQLRLSGPEEFQPVPAGTSHYVAALKNRLGERNALEHASPQTWEHFTPLLEVVGPKNREKKAFTRSRVDGWVKKVSTAAGRHPCFLDVLRLSPNHPTATTDGKVPVLSFIHASAQKRGMAFVPVMRLGDAAATTRQIAETAARDGRGVALRYPLLGTASADGRSAPTLIKELLNTVEIDVTGADLLMDLGYLSQDVEVHAEDLAPTVNELIGVGGWRSVVLLGTSIPSSLGDGIVVAGTVGRLPRREWTLWSALREADLARLPTYGDYAVQNPNPPLDVKDGQIPMGMRGDIRYTHATETIIPRAKAALWEEGRGQYRQLCKVLVDQQEFAGRDFTWGDLHIAECAEGTDEPGPTSLWRGAGTSHHLRYVVDQLSQVS
jgi:hypothetical protein